MNQDTKKIIDIDTWNRKEHFEFFRNFADPYFGYCVNIDCSQARQTARQKQQSFYLTYLHAATKAANSIEEFRTRYVAGQVVCYEQVNISPTVLRDDKTMGFSYIDYHPDFSIFSKNAQIETARVKASTGLCLGEQPPNTLHATVIPWQSFSSIDHVRFGDEEDVVPKLAFGKTFEQDGKLMIPVSMHAHHAFMDGYHVGLFFERLEEYLQQ
ncbi:chloramphenicol acetyltransferase [Pelagibaculum spongiae]|uniref:Chloramphenicol acetyltransferase n=1 Tax=Pelagibaculum spongiae TaxID=2080658 RepID=A0A2V1GWL9_9GAMM|nr:chloramphenicol acetyltransferase [Pelagibaculum spongiae]PVZ63549.1 chloramphenicol acetyltransferase [Pelagibaculum spongiae]